MNTLTLQGSAQLTKLATEHDLTEDELKRKIIDTYIKRKAITGKPEEVGKELMDIADLEASCQAVKDIFGMASNLYVLLISKHKIIFKG